MRDAPRSPSAQGIAIFSQLPVSGRQSGPTYAKRLCEFALARQTDAQSHAAIHDQQLQCSRQKAVGRLAFAVSSPMPEKARKGAGFERRRKHEKANITKVDISYRATLAHRSEEHTSELQSLMRI